MELKTDCNNFITNFDINVLNKNITDDYKKLTFAINKKEVLESSNEQLDTINTRMFERLFDKKSEENCCPTIVLNKRSKNTKIPNLVDKKDDSDLFWDDTNINGNFKGIYYNQNVCYNQKYNHVDCESRLKNINNVFNNYCQTEHKNDNLSCFDSVFEKEYVTYDSSINNITDTNNNPINYENKVPFVFNQATRPKMSSSD